MDEVIKTGKLTRFLEVQDFVCRKAAGDTFTRLSFAASSERPVERYFGNEVLSHDPASIRMERMTTGAAPLLFNHDANDPVGMIDSAKAVNGRLMVDAHLFNTTRAAEVEQMIAGGLRNVSIGYRLNTIEENKADDTFRATDWEPFEVSIVTVPADPSVGIGRGQGDAFEVRMVRSAPIISSVSTPAVSANLKEPKMGDPISAVAGNNAEVPKITAVEAESQRRAGIIALCKANKIDGRVEAGWIEGGERFEDTCDKNGDVIHKGIASQILDVMEERSKSKPSGAAALGLSSKETQRFSIVKAIRAMRFGGQTPKLLQDAAFELECSRTVAAQLNRELTSSILVPTEVLQRPLGEGATRAMATTPGSKGGYLVNIENMGFIDILRNRSVAMRMGARQLSGLTGNVFFPRQTGKVSVTWQAGEGTSVTAADQALGQLSMTPHTCIALTDVSEQLLRQSSVSAEQFIMADLAADVAIDGVDAAVISGTGGAQPLGIKNTTGVTTGQDSASATYAKVLAFVSTAGAANAIRGNPGFITTTAGAAKLMTVQRFTSTDTPVWEGNMLDGQLVKFNAMSSEQVPAANLIFGSWDECVIGDWGVLELSTDNGGTRFNQAQVGIRALWMVDVMLRYPQAFVVSTNLS
jgi:HK97 family phage major capsid protein/HK97 family phage prohead protease